jgi:hypothetical protein
VFKVNFVVVRTDFVFPKVVIGLPGDSSEFRTALKESACARHETNRLDAPCMKT